MSLIEDASAQRMSNVCQVCGKASKYKGQLKQHMLIHSGEKPHKCMTCDKSFRQISNLKTHISIHRGEKKYKCKTCDKSFTESGSLKRHVFVHSGEKKYKCGTCDKSSTSAGNIRKHILTHKVEREHKSQFKLSLLFETFPEKYKKKLVNHFWNTSHPRNSKMKKRNYPRNVQLSPEPKGRNLKNILG